MEQQDGNKVMAFDTLFSTNHIAMLKILLSCLDYQAQKSMAVYIKFLELQYTIHYYNILSAAAQDRTLPVIFPLSVKSFFRTVMKRKRNRLSSSAAFSKAWKCTGNFQK